MKFVVALAVLWLVTLAGAPTVLAGPMTYGESGRLEQFDPYTVHESSGHRLASLIFDKLVDVNAAGEYVASLAASWTILEGRTAVTIALRAGVEWHSPEGGEANAAKHYLNSADVVTTVRMLTAKESEIPNADRFAVLESAAAKDDLTVTIFFRRAVADPLRYLTFAVLPAHVLGATPALKRDNSFVRSPVGTGPYRFVSVSPRGEVLLKANPQYFRREPPIPEIVMRDFADQSVMAQSLMFNSLDFLTYLSPRYLSEVKADKRLKLIPYDALSYSFLALNTQSPTLHDRRVREALALSINRKEMLDAFFLGKGTLVSGPFPPTSWAYNLDVKPMTFDTAKAQEILKQAGFEDRDGDGVRENAQKQALKLRFVVPIVAENETSKRIVVAVTEYLKKSGVALQVEFVDWVTWKKRILGRHDYDMTIASWSFDDASNIASLFHSANVGAWGNNFVGYRNDLVDSLITEAQSTSDFDKRRAIFHKLHVLLARDVPYVYLWTLTHHAAHSSRVSGVSIDPNNFFRNILGWRLVGGKTNGS